MAEIRLLEECSKQWTLSRLAEDLVKHNWWYGTRLRWMAGKIYHGTHEYDLKE